MIRQVRDKLAAELALADPPWPVYAYKPDNVNEVPAIVIDRPAIDINVQHHTFTLAVVVIGRRNGTEDAQVELDETTSWVARTVAGPEFAVIRIEPATATVAELTYPAYQITVTCGVTYC